VLVLGVVDEPTVVGPFVATSNMTIRELANVNMFSD
jgi:hypothetical protein